MRAAPLLLLLVAGCSIDFDLDLDWPDSRLVGSEGRLRFSYEPAAAFDCFLVYCAIDHPIATHALVRVRIDDSDPLQPLFAAQPEVVELVAEVSETSRVTYVATVRAATRGPFTLTLRDAGRHLVDSIGLRAEDPVSAELVPNGSAIRVGATGTFGLRLQGVYGGELEAHDGVAWRIADPAVARVGLPAENLFGAGSDLIVHGEGEGATWATMRLGPFERSFLIRVLSAQPSP